MRSTGCRPSEPRHRPAGATLIACEPCPRLAETEHPTEIDGRPVAPGAQGMFCGWINALGGYAGMSGPGRPSADGRPIGVQLVAPSGGEEVLFELAYGLEEAAPWKDRWPALATTL